MNKYWKNILVTIWFLSLTLNFTLPALSSVAEREVPPCPVWERSQAGNHGYDSGFQSWLGYGTEFPLAVRADGSNWGIRTKATHSYNSAPVSTTQVTGAPRALPVAEVVFVAAKTLPVPKVANPKLGNIVSDLYKGAKGPNPIGTGSTADAVRDELATGLATHGKFHSQKAQEYINALNNWLRKNPNASDYDRLVAESLKRDLQSALGGK